MQKLVILVKSYSGDIKYVERLLESYSKYNHDKIPLYLIIPEGEFSMFEFFLEYGIKILTEESVTSNLIKDNSIRNIRPGYINQQIIKLAFWELELCENYFVMDSDGVFIREFYLTDFMFDSDTPFSILVEDNELQVDPIYYNQYWEERKRLIRNIQHAIGYEDSRILTCHSFAIFSCKVLESLNRNFMMPNNYNYSDLLKISPYEFSWYNMWLQKDKTIHIEIKEPLIKFFHQKSHHIEYINKGVTISDLARGFLGYNINSNYSRNYGVVNYEDDSIYLFSKKEIIAHFKKAFEMLWNKIASKLMFL